MPEQSEVYRGGNRIASPGLGNIITSAGGPPFVVVTNARLATTNPTRVYEALAGTSTNHGVLVRFTADAGSFIELYHVVTDTAGLPTVSTAPEIYVFGKCPDNTGRGGSLENRARLPEDVVASSLQLPSGLYIPIVTPGYTLGAPELVLDGAAVTGAVNGGGIQVSEPKYVFRSGCTEFFCTVKTAASITGTGTIASCIVARVVG